MFYSWTATLYALIPVLAIILPIYAAGLYKNILQWLSAKAAELLKLLNAWLDRIKNTDYLNETLEDFGYAYDPYQDIYYSLLDPWQKQFGYCRLYDEAAAPMSMIIDCEPIYFEYAGKRWMIEFWKGQYGMAAGCEVGVYNTEAPDITIPDIFSGTFFNCAGSQDYLEMSLILVRRNGKLLFTRKGMHWWLTGFKLGEFAEPSDLVMYIHITLKDRDMLQAFLGGLYATGYTKSEIAVRDYTVMILFSNTHTPQPLTRTKDLEEIMQQKNKLLCNEYQEITKGCNTQEEKITQIQKRAPELYRKLIGLGKPEYLYKAYKVISEYLNKFVV